MNICLLFGMLKVITMSIIPVKKHNCILEFDTLIKLWSGKGGGRTVL